MTSRREVQVLGLVQDSAKLGGVQTVNRWYRKWMDTNRPGEMHEVYLANLGSATMTESSTGLVPFLPRLHVPQYLVGRRMVRARFTDVRESHVIGGVAVHGFMAPSQPPLLVWLGTTIGSERRAVLPYRALHRRVLHTTTLPWLETIETGVLRRATHVFAQSQRTADDVLALGVPASRVQLLPIPVDPEKFSPDGGERSGILFVGRTADDRKNFAACVRLLRSSRLARDEGLEVVSPFPRRPDRYRDLSGSIRWWGNVEDLAERYRRAKVLALTSHQEGLGIVAFEALASGTPVVALPSGGADAYLIQSGGGVIADGEAHFLGQVERLLRDDAARAEMGAAGRAWVVAHMSPRKFLGDRRLFVAE